MNALCRVIHNSFCGAAACPGTLFGERVPTSKDDIEKSHGGDDSSFQRNVASFTSHAEEIIDDRDYVSSVNERTYEC